jgi:HSP20 family protein
MANESRTMTRRESNVPAQRHQMGGAFLSPFSLLRDMTELMDQVWEGGSDMPISRGERVWSPAVEVREKDNSIVVCAEVPGIDPKDVKVEVDNGMLVIQGERKREETHEEQGRRRSERMYGNFFRAIALPENAKTEQAKADVRNGVLEVTIPMEEAQSHRKQIPIGGQSGQSHSIQSGQSSTQSSGQSSSQSGQSGQTGSRSTQK